MKEKTEKGKRLLALDAARGLAVIGMFIQHFALNARNSFVSGNTMILFMLCSGISYTLMVKSMENKGAGPAAVRTRVLARSVFIDLAGYFLILLNGQFAVVLPAYAMLFILALTLVRFKTRTLFLLSGMMFFICPPLMLAGLSLFSHAAILSDIVGGPLSALAWAPVFVLGMAIGRCDFLETRFSVKMIACGAAVLIPFKLTAVFILPSLLTKFLNRLSTLSYYTEYQENLYAAWPHNTEPVLWQMLLMDAPQGGSTFELAIGTGAALIIIGALCLAEKKFSRLLKPFSRAGNVALSLYALQFVIAWGLSLAGIDVTQVNIGEFVLGDVLVAAAVLPAGWLLNYISGGPLERLMKRFEKLFI